MPPHYRRQPKPFVSDGCLPKWLTIALAQKESSTAAVAVEITESSIWRSLPASQLGHWLLWRILRWTKRLRICPPRKCRPNWFTIYSYDLILRVDDDPGCNPAWQGRSSKKLGAAVITTAQAEPPYSSGYRFGDLDISNHNFGKFNAIWDWSGITEW
jgi:hypothetical protein